uniref:Uncharacterized protein n=1 Tax=Oryza punctata TaxID=4537 RepID=A0A0E0K965_ORYPU
MSLKWVYKNPAKKGLIGISACTRIRVIKHPNNTNSLLLKHIKKKLPINFLSYMPQCGTAKPKPSCSKGQIDSTIT